MSTRDKTGDWIPLMDYAIKKGVSLSTLRRHIKADKILHRLDGGRYLLFDEMAGDSPAADPYKKIQTDLEKANEEIAELKTLIALYEERPHPRSS